jgi:hypothetical protein
MRDKEGDRERNTLEIKHRVQRKEDQVGSNR